MQNNFVESISSLFLILCGPLVRCEAPHNFSKICFELAGKFHKRIKRKRDVNSFSILLTILKIVWILRSLERTRRLSALFILFYFFPIETDFFPAKITILIRYWYDNAVYTRSIYLEREGVTTFSIIINDDRRKFSNNRKRFNFCLPSRREPRRHTFQW